MLISFIIPVYNVERYLSTCLDSILNQGLDTDDFEIILIEDCSTDKSLTICKDYCSKYKNITIVENEKNIGIGLTRNRGIACAKGDYIHFVDSDDLIFPNSLQDLFALNVITKLPDIIRFSSSRIINIAPYQNKIIYEGEFNNNCSLSPHLSAWCYWFRRHYLIENSINFPNKTIGEDAFFTFSALSRNPFIIVTSTIVYYYRQHNESITSKKDISYVNCLFEVVDEIKKISANSNLTALYITEVYRDIIARFYRSRRSLHECVVFKKKMKTFGQYDMITKGPWYLQLSRFPFILFIYFRIKRSAK